MQNKRVLLEVGKVPFVNSEIEATNLQVEHRRVLLRSQGSFYNLEVEGYSSGELPPATRDYTKAMKSAKRFIHRNNGSALRTPAVVANGPNGVGKHLVSSEPVEPVRSRRREHKDSKR